MRIKVAGRTKKGWELGMAKGNKRDTSDCVENQEKQKEQKIEASRRKNRSGSRNY